MEGQPGCQVSPCYFRMQALETPGAHQEVAQLHDADGDSIGCRGCTDAWVASGSLATSDRTEIFN
jgi:hypothetical protein